MSRASASVLPVNTPAPSFARVLGGVPPVGTSFDVGDAFEVPVWEGPPFTLFGGTVPDTRIGNAGLHRPAPRRCQKCLSGRRERSVRPSPARSPRAAEPSAKSCAAFAAKPMRLQFNTTSTFTVTSELNQSARLPLTPRGERLLDALAQVGGMKSPVNLTTIQVTR